MDEQSTPAPSAADEVEAVLATTDGLEERPLGEHLAVLERAHESLRRVLAGAGTRG